MTQIGKVGRIGDLELRPATMDDADFVADMYTALRPDDPDDRVVRRHWWSIEATDNVVERWIAMHDGRPVGSLFTRHAPWEKMPERFGRVSADLLPAVRTAARLDALYRYLEDRSRADGTQRFTTWAWENDAPLLDMVRLPGFKEERRQRFSACDLGNTPATPTPMTP